MRTLTAALSALLLSVVAAGCGNTQPTATPTSQPSLIQPTIIHPGTHNSGSNSANDLGEATSAWLTELATYVAKYPANATEAQRASLTAEQNAAPFTGLTCDPENLTNCWVGAETARRTWLVMGDDSVRQWLPAMKAIADKNSGLRIQVFTSSNCSNSADVAGLPSLGESGTTQQALDACIAQHTAALNYVATNRVQSALLIDSSSLIGGTRQQAYGKGLQTLLMSLKPHTSAIVIGRVPSWNVTPAACFNKDFSNLRSCYGSALGNAAIASFLQNAANSASAGFIDPRRWLCVRNTCPLFVNDRVVTLDGYRLTMGAASALAPVLYENVEAQLGR